MLSSLWLSAMPWVLVCELCPHSLGKVVPWAVYLVPCASCLMSLCLLPGVTVPPGAPRVRRRRPVAGPEDVQRARQCLRDCLVLLEASVLVLGAVGYTGGAPRGPHWGRRCAARAQQGGQRRRQRQQQWVSWGVPRCTAGLPRERGVLVAHQGLGLGLRGRRWGLRRRPLLPEVPSGLDEGMLPSLDSPCADARGCIELQSSRPSQLCHSGITRAQCHSELRCHCWLQCQASLSVTSIHVLL